MRSDLLVNSRSFETYAQLIEDGDTEGCLRIDITTLLQHLWYRDLVYLLSQEKCKYLAIHKLFNYNGVLYGLYFHLFLSHFFLHSSLVSPTDSMPIFAL